MNSNVVIIIVIAVVVIIFLLIGMYNRAVSLSKRIERSRATLDAFLKKRFDLIPNLVEVTKGYSKYEKDVLTKITELRTSFEKDKEENTAIELNEHYKKLLAIVEKYPEIKAGEQFLNLQKQLASVEDEISAQRRIYINDLTDYNTYIKVFPNKLLLSSKRFPEEKYPEFEYEEVKVDFKEEAK